MRFERERELAQRHGLSAYHNAIKDNPALKDAKVLTIALRATYILMGRLSPDEAEALVKGRIYNGILDVLEEDTWNPTPSWPEPRIDNPPFDSAQGQSQGTQGPKRRNETRLDSDIKDEIWERIVSASFDPAIANYFLNGIGQEESLIAHLQREYKLSEDQALNAIDKGIAQLSETTDYGD